MPGAGFEPARPFGQWILSPSRQPLRHPGCATNLPIRAVEMGQVNSSFRADELIQHGDAGSSCDRQIVCIVRPPLDCESVTGGAEESSDIRGSIAEVVARVRGAVHPVEYPAPMEVKQAAEERRWEPADDRLLATSELDWPLVLGPSDRVPLNSTRSETHLGTVCEVLGGIVANGCSPRLPRGAQIEVGGRRRLSSAVPLNKALRRAATA